MLCSELAWENGKAKVFRASVDFGLLGKTSRTAALVIRVGAYDGPFESDGTAFAALASASNEALEKARRAGLSASELQVDFDCPESRLDGYADWIEALRDRLAPVPVTITALPCWLDRPAFRRLAGAAPRYVLQVHSLQRPGNARDEAVFFDPLKAHAWIESAARLGVPFRVALPTFTYVLGFDKRTGRLVGLSAEGAAASWSADVETRFLQADPRILARFVRALEADRPELLERVTWFRLPVAGDRFNWPWRTLAAVMSGREPHAKLDASVRSTEPGLVEVGLANEGDAVSVGPIKVCLAWRESPADDDCPLLAFDGLGGFSVTGRKPGEMILRGAPDLAPHAQRPIAWLRWSKPMEVTARVESTP